MTTLTHLEDMLRRDPSSDRNYCAMLTKARNRLQQSLQHPKKQAQYKEITLLLGVVNQAEDVIRIIANRYKQQMEEEGV